MTALNNTSTHEHMNVSPPTSESAGAVWHHLFTDDGLRYKAASEAAAQHGKIIGHLEWELAPDAYHRNIAYRYRNFCLWVLFADLEQFVAYLKARG